MNQLGIRRVLNQHDFIGFTMFLIVEIALFQKIADDI
jgi:hypothetical protein